MLYGGRPPADVSASALFRLLLAVPYAERPIDYRLRGAEDVSLSVRALRSCDEADLLDVWSGHRGRSMTPGPGD